mmetsp:Transcript_26548/g.103390  ORF Transcript_26548/g.103390 Transcript_26548/m.103390 type:complete len:246 (+) Transcript_26548:360-1097(+)
MCISCCSSFRVLSMCYCSHSLQQKEVLADRHWTLLRWWRICWIPSLTRWWCGLSRRWNLAWRWSSGSGRLLTRWGAIVSTLCGWLLSEISALLMGCLSISSLTWWGWSVARRWRSIPSLARRWLSISSLARRWLPVSSLAWGRWSVTPLPRGGVAASRCTSRRYTGRRVVSSCRRIATWCGWVSRALRRVSIGCLSWMYWVSTISCSSCFRFFRPLVEHNFEPNLPSCLSLFSSHCVPKIYGRAF